MNREGKDEDGKGEENNTYIYLSRFWAKAMSVWLDWTSSLASSSSFK